LGQNRIPGTIGTDSSPEQNTEASPGVNAWAGFALPGPTRGLPLQSGRTGGAGREIIVIATFPRPWPSDAEEINNMQAQTWSPSDVDFNAVAQKDKRNATIFTVKSFGEFLGAIQSVPAKSLQRAVVITHANAGLIAFSGTVAFNQAGKTNGSVFLTVSGGVNSPLTGGLDVDALLGLRNDSSLVNDLRGRFTGKQAEILLVCCHAGQATGLLLLQDLAVTLQATVKSFKDSIFYCPAFRTAPPPPSVTDRTLTGAGSCSNAQSGFSHLNPQVVAAPP
jgi:hypothetical protein